MAAPGAYNLTLVQGDDVAETFTFRDDTGTAIDITGYTFAAQMRPYPSSSSVTATFTVAISGAGSGGTVTMTLARAVTATISAGRYHWDLEWTDTANRKRTLLAGVAVVLEEVTR